MRRIVVLILVALLAVVPAPTASAAVVSNERIPLALVVGNPCAPGDGPISLSGEVHVVVQQKNGTFHTRINAHGSGVGAIGTRYQANAVAEGITLVGSPLSARGRLVSQGSSDNMHITFTVTVVDLGPPPVLLPVVGQLDCRG